MPIPTSWRWRLFSHLSSKLPHRKNKDPSAALERLETWSFWATVVILGGIVLEAWGTIHFAKPTDTIGDILSKLVADALIGVGLLVEAICIVSAIFETRREKHESDEKVAEANARAAMAQKAAAEANRAAEEERLARVKLESKLANRRLLPEEINRLSIGLQKLNLQTKSITVTRLSDHEAHGYATSIIRAVNNAGIYPDILDMLAGPPRYGLQITPNLKPAFDEAGIRIDGLISGPEGVMQLPEIFVGLKRPEF